MSFDWKHQGMNGDSRLPMVDPLTQVGFTGTGSHPLVRNNSTRGRFMGRNGRYTVLFTVLLLLTCILSGQAEEPPKEPDQASQPEPDEAPKPEPDEAPKPEPDEAPKPEPDEAPKPKPDEAPKPEPDEAPKPEPDEAPKPEPDEAPKPAPVEAPKPEPDEAPQPEPDEAPKPAPVEAPKPEPDEAPQPEPDEAPKPAPVEAPQPEPDKAPQPAPDEAPKPAPVEAPQPEPDEAPQPEPDKAPQPEPAEASTPAPVEAPQPEPDEAPQPEPSEAPQPEPAEAPTPAPVEVLQPEPSEARTPAPVVVPQPEAPLPAPDPTKEPEITPEATDEPTRKPVQDPTDSKSPTMAEPDEVPEPPPSEAPQPSPDPTKEAESTPEATDKPTAKPVRDPATSMSPTMAPDEPDRTPLTVTPTSAAFTFIPSPMPNLIPPPTPWPFPPSPRPTSSIEVATPSSTLRPTTALASESPASPTSTQTTSASDATPASASPSFQRAPNLTTSQPQTPSPTSTQTSSASDAMAAPSVSAPAVPTEEAQFELELPLQELNENIQLIIGGIILPLSLSQLNVLEVITSDFIADAIIGILGADQIENLEVDASVISSYSERMLHAPSDKMKGSRKLAETSIALRVVILIQSLIENHDVGHYIYDAFNDDEEKAMFLNALKQTGNAAFVNVDSISVVPLSEDEDPTTEVEDPTQGQDENPPRPGIFSTNDEDNNETAVIVISIVIVLLGGIGLISFFVCRGRRTAGGGGVQKDVSTCARKAIESVEQAAIGAEIEILEGPELSSLGDPIPFSVRPSWETIGGSVNGISGAPDDLSLDYDFQKAFNNDFSSSSRHTESNPPSLLTKDDNTLSVGYVLKEEAEKFEVEAPPGLLGLVLEPSTEEGIPTVHMIKHSSPLAGQVRVGDRLLRVDGLDVSVMWAHDAAHYVASKQNNPARLLVFARLRGNDASTQPTDPTDCELEA